MRTAWTDDETYLVRSMSWSDRENPALELVDIADAVTRLPLVGATLAFFT
ncbi:hypothetical protein GPV19_24510, partial [Salmonella enterica subsp. enterica serovar Typhimurium]|nr:hypothetical protein [Salmonella enterica subsp. enterica serovar Typhimurium]